MIVELPIASNPIARSPSGSGGQVPLLLVTSMPSTVRPVSSRLMPSMSSFDTVFPLYSCVY